MRTEQEKINTQKIADFADKTLLIVDDDNPLRDRLARAMEKKGFKVIQAENVEKGISYAKNAPPAFAVVDLRLGDGNGLEVVKEIRRLKKDSRVIMLTGYGNIPTAVEAIKAGAIDYIPKPADADDVESYTLSIVEDPIEKNLLFLGTDDGLYVSTNAGGSWMKWTRGFPTVSVKDLVIQEREDDLVIGTFGRAAWVLDDIRPLREIAKNTNILNEPLRVFNPPTAYQAAYQQPTGSRFGGDALYNGENRPGGARISYYFKKDESSADAKEMDTEDMSSDDETENDSSKFSFYIGRHTKTYTYHLQQINCNSKLFH